MAHWSDGYINVPHEQLDCGELVERALHEQFGRTDICFPRKSSSDLDHRAGLIVGHAADFARPIDAPVDGCGVLMFARGRRAHIGLYCEIEGVPYVLHSDALFGTSTRMPLSRLKLRYRIEGWYAWI
jgi:hypothetical protein